jgi:glutathione synthase/RimK-type ligase-like ATP-grasp enzyme
VPSTRTSRDILIISNPTDEHARTMAALLRTWGHRVTLFYPEDLGRLCSLTLSDEIGSRLSCGREVVDLSQVHAVWYRRPRPPKLKRLHGPVRDFARDEWRAALEGAYVALGGAFWVNEPDAELRAHRKELQRAVAREVGLSVPRTVITSDPRIAAWFVESVGGPVVAKATGRGWVSDGRSRVRFVLTNRLSRAARKALDEVKHAPVTFQEEVPKRHELRVNVVGSHVLAIRIESQRSRRSRLDWRRYDLDRTPQRGRGARPVSGTFVPRPRGATGAPVRGDRPYRPARRRGGVPRGQPERSVPVGRSVVGRPGDGYACQDSHR